MSTPRWEALENAVIAQLAGLGANVAAFDGPNDLLFYVPKSFPSIVVSWKGTAWTKTRAQESWITSEGVARIFTLVFVEDGSGAGEARRGTGGGFWFMDQIAARLHGFDTKLPAGPLKAMGPLSLAEEVDPEIVGSSVRLGAMFNMGVSQSQGRPAKV